MAKARYGHCSVFVKGFIYVIGGYAHPDTPESCKDPKSLKDVEKYQVKEGSKEEAWKMCQPMGTD